MSDRSEPSSEGFPRYPTPHFDHGRRGHLPRGIVVHTTVGTLDGTLEWFANPRSGVSAHYVVAWDGSVLPLIEERDTARHAGTVVSPTTPLVSEDDPNLYTIGIEFEDRGEPSSGRRPDRQYQAGAGLIREIAARWNIPLDREHVVGHREIRANKECPGDLDVGRLVRQARGEPAEAGTGFVCLLPVRNGEAELPGYFSCVSSFADAVLALDDGSTDRTRELLDGEPLVKLVLTNPRRDTYAGWDDAANRNRLLAAASELNPDWILSLDADERIDPTDAAALKTFVEGDALPGFAYGFRVHRMIGSLREYDRAGLWVYRLFAFDPAHRFTGLRLHFVPVPDSIPPRRWLKTTLRIQHLGGLTEEQRHARFAKYGEADAERTFQADYTSLLEPPGPLLPWEPRPADLPILVQDTDPERLAELDLDAPVLSAIVIARNDERTIERSVRSVVEQECPEPFEVVVVASGTDSTPAIIRREFPDVILVHLDDPALPGRARNAGLSLARGDYVSFPGSHVELPPGSLAARLRAHEQGYAMVTGSTLNGTRTRSGWASYFLDHCASSPDRPSGPLNVPPAHCSYLRLVLEEVGGFPEDLRAGEDTMVNLRIWESGYNAYRSQDIELVHRSPCRNPWRLIAHHFVRGRALGQILLGEARKSGRGVLRRRVLRRYVRRRLALTSGMVERWGGDRRRTYRSVRPLVLVGILAAWLGGWFELLRPGRGKGPLLFARGPRRAYA